MKSLPTVRTVIHELKNGRHFPQVETVLPAAIGDAVNLLRYLMPAFGSSTMLRQSLPASIGLRSFVSVSQRISTPSARRCSTTGRAPERSMAALDVRNAWYDDVQHQRRKWITHRPVEIPRLTLYPGIVQDPT